MQERFLNLKLAGPFHTEKLEIAASKLKNELDNIDISYADEKKVIKNIDGEMYKDSDSIKEILSKHVMNPVRFKNGLEKMIELGVDTFVEIGPR